MNPEKEWKRISPHNHTAAYSGCSEISPLNLIAGSAQAGLHGLIVTEHNHLWDSEELSQLKQRAVREKLCPPDFLLFAGREVTATAGGKTAHALVFGYNGNIPVGMDLTALCNYVHDRNGVIVLAHPCRNSGRQIERFWEYPADGAEFYSQNQQNPVMKQLTARYRPNFALFGSDDVHKEEHIGHFITLFPYWVRTEEDLVEAIRLRSVRPHEIGKKIYHIQ